MSSEKRATWQELWTCDCGKWWSLRAYPLGVKISSRTKFPLQAKCPNVVIMRTVFLPKFTCYLVSQLLFTFCPLKENHPVYFVNRKGHLVTLTSGQSRPRSRINLNRSSCISKDASWQDEYFGTYPISFQSKVIGETYIDLMTSSFDLSWPIKGLLMQNCTGMSSLAIFIIILNDLKRSDRYLRYLIFPPLNYNGQVTKLTWPEVNDMTNPRYTICRVIYPYCTLQVSKCSGQSCALDAMSNFAKMRPGMTSRTRSYLPNQRS